MAKTKTRTVVRYAPRKRSRRRNRMTLPIGIIAPVAITAVKAAGVYQSTGSLESAGRNYFAYYTGYTGNPAKSWEWQYMKYGLLPLALGAFVHKLASKAGINNMIARTGIPFIRI